MTPPADFQSLAGQLLVAMPNIADTRFHRAVIFICAHDKNGAMGLVLTKGQPGHMLDQMMAQMKIPCDVPAPRYTPVLQGGPVDTGRGFVLHPLSYRRTETIAVNDEFGVTATVDTLRDIGRGAGPEKYLFILGYAGWAAGQLEREMTGTAWLVVPATDDLVFETPIEGRWEQAMKTMGVDPVMLMGTVGNA
jgi:putative transcriptional regulator